MAGLVPAIHVFADAPTKTWMPATSAGMTSIAAAFEPDLLTPDFAALNPGCSLVSRPC
jgi:hypothetical protein